MWITEEEWGPITSELPNSGDAYIIDLQLWGIKRGIPNKPYVYDDYVKADANIQGINAAFQYAYNNGYSQVVLPRGEYAICYPRSINIDKSHMTLDFNGSILKVIYDSDNQSPFDTADRSVTQDYYNFVGNSIVFTRAHHSHVRNLRLIGCRVDRSFIKEWEKAEENSYGIVVGHGSSHCTVKHCTVSDFMGDNISFNSRSELDYGDGEGSIALGLTLNDLDPVTGMLTDSTTSLVSKLIPIEKGYDSFLIAGPGFTRQTGIISKKVDIFYYKADGSYIRRSLNVRIYTHITIPNDAAQLRLVFRNETDTAKNMYVVFRYGLIPHRNVVAHNEIYSGHRGGITLGGSYNVVEHNYIHDNGYNFIDGKPLFNDPTRYGINQEDSYGDSCIIRNNLFYNLNHGVLMGCWSTEIYDNFFYKNVGVAINLYTLQNAKIKGNYIYNCGSSLGLMQTHLDNANVLFSDNMIVETPMNTFHTGEGYDVKLINNTFVDSTVTMPRADWYVFKDNNIRMSKFGTGWVNMNISKMEGCTFETKGTRRKVAINGYEVKNCTFKNIEVEVSTPNQTTLNETFVFTDCEFKESPIRDFTFGNSRRIEIRNSELIDTIPTVGAINVPTQVQSIGLYDCKITAKTIDHLLFEEVNSAYATADFIDCEIIIDNPSFSKMINGFYGRLEASFKKCRISYTGATPLVLSYHGGINKIRKFISSKNRFINITLPAPDAKYIGYDPHTQSEGEPNTGQYHFVTDVVMNASPNPGEYMGWICLSEGIACTQAWVASSAYEIGGVIYVSNRVYRCKISGNSGSTSPVHTAGTAADGTVTWEYLGTKAVFGEYGLIA